VLRLRTVPPPSPWSPNSADADDDGGCGAGAVTATASPSSSDGPSDARTAAALSSTEGTLCSSASVFFERAVRCGSFGRAGEVAFGRAEGEERWRTGSMSRSNMAEEEECLEEGRSVRMWRQSVMAKERQKQRQEGNKSKGAWDGMKRKVHFE
jgi:hypothetical protein